MPRDIDFYLNRAKAQIGTKSDRELARHLGYKGPTVHHFRKRVAWPSDDVMLHLADLAGVDPETALLELSTWRTAGRARQAYEKILAALVAALVLFATWSPAAHAGNKPAPASLGLYIMENILRRAWRKILWRYQAIKASIGAPWENTEHAYCVSC